MLEVASIDHMVGFMEISVERDGFRLATSHVTPSMVVIVDKEDSR